MKKVFMILAACCFCAMMAISCTEKEPTDNLGGNNGGGGNGGGNGGGTTTTIDKTKLVGQWEYVKTTHEPLVQLPSNAQDISVDASHGCIELRLSDALSFSATNWVPSFSDPDEYGFPYSVEGNVLSLTNSPSGDLTVAELTSNTLVFSRVENVKFTYFVDEGDGVGHFDSQDGQSKTLVQFAKR